MRLQQLLLQQRSNSCIAGVALGQGLIQGVELFDVQTCGAMRPTP